MKHRKLVGTTNACSQVTQVYAQLRNQRCHALCMLDSAPLPLSGETENGVN